MNKSVLTNLIAAALILLGWVLAQPWLLTVGLFALSGALTNWLAIHMLFEKVPGLYGSGVIPARFESFKGSLQQLMMTQFFSAENIDRFLRQQDEYGEPMRLELGPVIEQVELDPAFDALLKVVEGSKFGSMLSMVGGNKVLQPLREPFIQELKTALIDIADSDEFQQQVLLQLEQPEQMQHMQQHIETIVAARINELTPELVKSIVQQMIHEHLGWLVVWGGFFGGLLGLLAALLLNQ
ncbi:DUF445 domain-containing protein [Alkalimonas collagenimarina]|uniref:DUF445 domain-containing protein n=1 Tax=Alkalimonas collagenimarina TaxID=400390 RepID=A0ABT9GYR3_9GAMM|nr:DUF445 domain-containing protein [Alkalimonas collagenimarina]MDP4536158.1 DUF445 domain-containing protein [Alkalimonas collagenimarina]